MLSRFLDLFEGESGTTFCPVFSIAAATTVAAVPENEPDTSGGDGGRPDQRYGWLTLAAWSFGVGLSANADPGPFGNGS